MRAVLVSLVWLLCLPALAAAPAAKAPAPAAAPVPAGDPFDVSAVKAKLLVLTDGKGHYLALVKPFSMEDHDQEVMFYSSDGKVFWEQLRAGGGKNGDKWDRAFWEPRQKLDRQAPSVWRSDDGYQILCDERTTALTLLSAEDGKKIVDAATFFKRRWKHKAVALARDDTGTYFFVDRPVEPKDNKLFRVFRGKRGEVKPLAMTNIVDDSEGTIFETKQGKLRVNLDKAEADQFWTVGKTKVKLKLLPIDANLPLIYTELGAYSGPLGTPCDDL
jgi:hypothetical protein